MTLSPALAWPSMTFVTLFGQTNRNEKNQVSRTNANGCISSQFSGLTDNLDGVFGAEGTPHAKLHKVGPPLVLVYSGPLADYSWDSTFLYFTPQDWELMNTGDRIANLDI